MNESLAPEMPMYSGLYRTRMRMLRYGTSFESARERSVDYERRKREAQAETD